MALAFAVLLLVAIGPSVAAIRGLSAVHQAAGEVRAGWLPASRLLGQVGRSYARLRIVDTRIVVSADPALLRRGQAMTVSTLDALRQAVRSYDLLPMPAIERRAAVERAALLAEYMDARAKVDGLAQAGHWAAAADLWFGEASQLFQSYNYRLDISTTRMAQLADAATERVEDTYQASLWLLIEGAAAAIVAAVATGLALVTLVATPITRMAGRREADLKSANARFDAALGHMSQGLCMYDDSERLAVVNARYCEIFGIPVAEVRLGATGPEMIALRCAYGNHDGTTAAGVYRVALDAIDAQGVAAIWRVQGSGGRVIEVAYRAMVGGGSVVTYDDVTQRCQAEEQAVFLARHDALTGLPNRTLFQERVEQELAQVGRGTGVLYVDLDRFKEVNDSFGHPVGDSLLRAVADRLRALVRQGDMVARLGGDEFAVVQVGLERASDAAALAQRIVDALGAPFELELHTVTVGASVGVALAPTDARQFEQLVKCADTALYRAKQGGRGGFRFFERQMDTQRQERREPKQDRRRGLADGEFEMAHQQPVTLRHGGTSCFESQLG